MDLVKSEKLNQEKKRSPEKRSLTNYTGNYTDIIRQCKQNRAPSSQSSAIIE